VRSLRNLVIMINMHIFAEPELQFQYFYILITTSTNYIVVIEIYYKTFIGYRMSSQKIVKGLNMYVYK